MMTRRVIALVTICIAIMLQSGCEMPHTGSLTDRQLEQLRQCESSGNYQAVSRSGKFRGAYQFDRRTWASVGGSGDPAAAAPWEQDYRARLLYDARGRSPWPHCGRRI